MLTKQEEEILQHIVNGYDIKRISEISGINEIIVRKNIAHVFTKLHLHPGTPVVPM